MSNTQITGIKIEVTDAIREHVNSHFSKLNSHFESIVSQSVTFSKEGHKFKVHAEVNTGHGVVSATSEGQEFNPMIKDVVGKLNRQLMKQKGTYSKESIRDFEEELDEHVADEEVDYDEAV